MTTKVPPDYPAIARQLKIEGAVELEAVVTESGAVEKVNIVSGNPVLTRPASDAVKKWKFAPFTSDGKAVKAVGAGQPEFQDVVAVSGETKTMSLTKKLLSSFGAMLGLVLLLGAGGLLVTRDLSGDLERAANVTARQQYLAGQVSADAAELTSLERGSVLAAMLADAAHQQAYQQAFSEHAASLRKALSELRKMAEYPRGGGAPAESGTAGRAGGAGARGTAPGDGQPADGCRHGDLRAKSAAEFGGDWASGGVAGGTADPRPGVGLGRLLRQIRAQHRW